MRDFYCFVAFTLVLIGGSNCAAFDVFGSDNLTLVDTVGPIGNNAEDVKLSGDTFIAGGGNVEASLFKWDGTAWQEEEGLVPWDGARGNFGYSVAIDSDVAVVSNTYDNDYHGSVYIYEKVADAWRPAEKFELPSDSRNEWLGSQVATNGEWVASGAPRGRNQPGSLFLYHREQGSWVQHSVLQAPDLARGDLFGDTVDLSDNRMIVGASTDGDQQGAAYVYELIRGEWELQTKLVSPEPVPNEFFGQRVAIDGGTAVVGSTGNAAAYVYQFNGTDWYYVSTLTPSTRDNGNYPRTIDIDGGLIAVSAPYNSSNRPNDGLASIFARTRNGWKLVETFDSPVLGLGDHFGLSVNLEDRRLLVSAYAEGGTVFSYAISESVPEPSALLVATGGLLLVVLARRSRRTRTSLG